LSKKNHQKVRVLTTLAIKSIKSDNFYVDFSVVCECGTPCEKIYVLAALIMSNIQLVSKKSGNENFPDVNLVLSICQLIVYLTIPIK
jgi:hypothetical protein